MASAVNTLLYTLLTERYVRHGMINALGMNITLSTVKYAYSPEGQPEAPSEVHFSELELNRQPPAIDYKLPILSVYIRAARN